MRAGKVRLTAWFAIAAIVLQGLWPLLANARPASSILVPICTVEGVTHYVELPSGGTPKEGTAAGQHDHCAFCAFELARILPLVPTAHRFALLTASHAALTAYISAPDKGRLHHPPAQPRAPPAIRSL